MLEILLGSGRTAWRLLRSAMRMEKPRMVRAKMARIMRQSLGKLQYRIVILLGKPSAYSYTVPILLD